MQGLICDMKGGEKEVLRVEIMICESMLKGVFMRICGQMEK